MRRPINAAYRTQHIVKTSYPRGTSPPPRRILKKREVRVRVDRRSSQESAPGGFESGRRDDGVCRGVACEGRSQVRFACRSRPTERGVARVASRVVCASSSGQNCPSAGRLVSRGASLPQVFLVSEEHREQCGLVCCFRRVCRTNACRNLSSSVFLSFCGSCEVLDGCGVFQLIIDAWHRMVVFFVS